MNRIEWSEDGSRFVTRRANRSIALWTVTGERIRSIGTAMDARWIDRDHVLSIDDAGELRWHGPVGVAQQRRSVVPQRATVATLASSAFAAAYYVRGSNRATSILAIDSLGSTPYRDGEDGSGLRWIAPAARVPADLRVLALSPDARRLAYGYVADGARVAAIIDVRTGETVASAATAGNARIVRGAATVVEPVAGSSGAEIAFAFDRSGRHCVIGFAGAVAPQDGAGGDVRVRGNVTACAIDGAGAIAAFANGDRLRFEFPDGSELAYDHGVGEIVALAFDPASHRLACLDSEGRIEVVPVP